MELFNCSFSATQGSDATVDDSDLFETSSEEEELPPGSKIPDDYTEFCQKVVNRDLYKCKECVFLHRYPSKVRRHYYYKHAKYNPYQCTYCDFGAVESGKVKRHCQLMHGDLPVKVIKRSLKPLPDGQIPSISLMSDSRSDDVELEEGPGGKDEQKILAKYIIKKPGNIQECRCCGYSQEGASSLKRHVLAIHIHFYPYACTYCNTAMLEINKMKIHIDRAHPGLPYKIIKRKLTEDTGELAGETDEQTAGGFQHRKIKEEKTDGGEYSAAMIHQTKVKIKLEKGLGENSTEGTNLAPGEELVNISGKKSKKLSRCIYCGYTSHWNIKDVKLHIFRVHQKKNPFMCGHCGYGNVIRERVRNHCKKQHPEQPPNVRDKRKGMDQIMPLEETDEHMMVGVMTPSGIPITDINKLKTGSLMRAPQRSSSSSTSELTQSSLVSSAHRLTSPRMAVQPVASEASESLEPTNMPKDSKQRYLCKVCQLYRTHHLDNLLYHILAKHQQQKPYKCKHCEEARWRRGDIQLHIEQQHNGKPVDDVLYMVREKRRELLQFVSFAPKDLSIDQRPEAAAGPRPVPTSPVRPQLSRTFAAAKEQKRKYAAVLGFGKKSYNCHLCPQSYRTAKALWAHRRTHYTYRPFACTYCNFSGFYSAYILQHCLKAHPTLKPQVKKIEKPTIMEIDQTDKRISQEGSVDSPCSPAGISSPPAAISSPSPMSSATHVSTDEPESEFLLGDETPQRGSYAMKCDHCGVLRPHQQGMEVHQSKAHAGLPVSYRIIQSNAQDPRLLLADGVATGDGQCMLSCKQCSFTSRLSTVMRHHLMSHLDYKPYACSYCKFRAVRSYAIKVHLQRIHPAKPGRIVRQINKEMEAKLKKGFNRYALDSAECHDTSLTPSSPDGIQSPDREAVMNTCKHCSFKSKNSTIIRHHVMAHLQYKPYSCGYCSMQTIRPYDVKTHSIKMHPGNPPRTIHRKDDEMEELVKQGFDRHVGPATDEFFQEDPPPPNTFKPPVMPKLIPAPNSPSGTAVADTVVRSVKHEVGASPPMTSPPAVRTPFSANRSQKQAVPKTKIEYHCALCGVKKVSRVDIERHIMWDINYKPISCPYCPYRQVLICDVKRHVTTKHKDMPLKILRKNNPVHEIRLAELVTKSTHHVKQTPTPVPSPSPSPSPSTSSSVSFPPSTPTPPPQMPRVQSPLGLSSPTLRSVLSAPLSGTARKSTATARKSMRPPSEERVVPHFQHPPKPAGGFACKECNFVCSSKKYLSNHMIRHRPKKYQCSYCEQRVHYPHEMMAHLARKHSKMPVKFEKLIKGDSRLDADDTRGEQLGDVAEDQDVLDQDLMGEETGTDVTEASPAASAQHKLKRATVSRGKMCEYSCCCLYYFQITCMRLICHGINQ